MSNPHPHADLMKLYAEDAAETATPWQRWEFRSEAMVRWAPVKGHPVWYESSEYRRKPRMRSLNGFEYPEPERMAPVDGTRYWIPNIRMLDELTTLVFWSGSVFDFFQLRRGLVHLSKENAEAHTRAIILAGGGEV